MGKQVVDMPVKLPGLLPCQAPVPCDPFGNASARASDIHIASGRKKNFAQGSYAQG
jgi:hypothetical protein